MVCSGTLAHCDGRSRPMLIVRVDHMNKQGLERIASGVHLPTPMDPPSSARRCRCQLNFRTPAFRFLSGPGRDLNPHVLSDTRPKPCASTSSATGPPEAVGASTRTELTVAPLIQKSWESIAVGPGPAGGPVISAATRPDRPADYRRVVLARLAIRLVLAAAGSIAAAGWLVEVLLPRRGQRKHHHHHPT